jgi:hypothetical protein
VNFTSMSRSLTDLASALHGLANFPSERAAC